MKQTDKIGFEDIFDLQDIEKVFEQTIEYDILKLMEQWEKKKDFFLPTTKGRARLIHRKNCPSSYTRRNTKTCTRARYIWGKVL